MPSTYEYLDLLAITAVLPAVGAVTGGLSVQVIGAGFRDGATVDFGTQPSLASPGVEFVDDGLLTCIVPPSITGEGPVDVTVTLPDGTFATLLDGFTYQPGATFHAANLDRVRYGSVRLRQTLGQPRTGNLRLMVAPDPTVDVQIIALDQLGIAGVITNVTQLTEGKKTQLAWDVELCDYVARLNERRPTGSYTQSITSLVQVLMRNFAPGFQLHVQASLPSTTIELDGTIEFSGVLTELANRASEALGGSPGAAVTWFIDGVDLWFGAGYTGPHVPSVLDDDNPYLILSDETPVRLETDYTQLRNRVTLKGPFDLTVVVNDVESQGQWRLRERTYKVGLEDLGLTEDDADALTAAARMQDKATAEVAAFRQPIVSLKYAIRDLYHRPGLVITANLTNPPVVGVFMIQEVEIDQVNVATGIRYESDGITPLPIRPRVQVNASPVRFDFGDWMRAAPQTGFGGALAAPNMTGDIVNTDISDDACITSTKLADSGVGPGTYGSGA